MNALLHQAQLLLARLSPREQRLVAVFASLVAVVVAWSLVLAPFLSGRDRVRGEINQLQSELAQLSGLAGAIRRSETERARAGKSGRGGGAAGSEAAKKGFSVLAFVEKAAGASLRPESIASMSPARRPADEGREESTVELKLTEATLGEVVALLRAIEGERGPVYIKQFSVRKRYDDASRFDATLVAAALLPA